MTAAQRGSKVFSLTELVHRFSRHRLLLISELSENEQPAHD